MLNKLSWTKIMPIRMYQHQQQDAYLFYNTYLLDPCGDSAKGAIILPTNMVQSAAAPPVAGEMLSRVISSPVPFLVTLLIGPRLQQ